nr:hypothetical protein [Aneurinibacillus tyrosinisolvens]
MPVDLFAPDDKLGGTPAIEIERGMAAKVRMMPASSTQVRPKGRPSVTRRMISLSVRPMAVRGCDWLAMAASIFGLF